MRARNASASPNSFPSAFSGPAPPVGVGGSYIDADTLARRFADLDDTVADRRCPSVPSVFSVNWGARRLGAFPFDDAVNDASGDVFGGETSVCRRAWPSPAGRETNFAGGRGAANAATDDGPASSGATSDSSLACCFGGLACEKSPSCPPTCDALRELPMSLDPPSSSTMRLFFLRLPRAPSAASCGDAECDPGAEVEGERPGLPWAAGREAAPLPRGEPPMGTAGGEYAAAVEGGRVDVICSGGAVARCCFS